jgi:hypothetical protein
MATNLSTLPDSEFAALAAEIDLHRSLRDVLGWAAKRPEDVHRHIVAEVVTQDEFTHDIVVPYRNVFLVYDTT